MNHRLSAAPATLLLLLAALWVAAGCASQASTEPLDRADAVADATPSDQDVGDGDEGTNDEADAPSSEEAPDVSEDEAGNPSEDEAQEAARRAAAAEAHDLRFGEAPPFDDGTQEVSDPFVGVRILARTTPTPRPLRYWVVYVDPEAEGIGYRVTPSNGDEPRETTRQTTVDFAREHAVQLAINAHFFIPWPAEDDYAEILGLAVNDGQIVSTFQDVWEHALVIDTNGAPTMVSWDRAAGTSTATLPATEVAYAVGGRERVLTAGENTGTWLENHPRTIAGIHEDGFLVFLILDGRQNRRSEGVTTPEAGEILLSLGVPDALNLDGGGSSTLVIADPEVRVLNSPVGMLLPGSLRANGSNLGIYAQPWP